MRDTFWTDTDMGKSCVKPVEKTNKSIQIYHINGNVGLNNYLVQIARS